jgi:lipopolysaccharide/colanic/teichoic acid biosynthesis glycosyltransferase
MDLILALSALILLIPALLIISICVRFTLGKPVIFKQKRAGLNEKNFWIYKFRTMTDKKDEHGKLLSDKLRLTPFGRFLRVSSIDELPELWNIVRGDMSIVGPRPLLVQYLPLYNDNQKRRHEVRPGLTGLAQVSGRNLVKWEDRFKLDNEYIAQISFIRDLRIILATIRQILLRDGIYSETGEPMELFRGGKEEGSDAFD